MTIYRCPRCNSKESIKNGRDFRLSDSRYQQRYICKECGKHYSSATFSKAVNQNKRRLNNKIYKLLVHGMSIANIASYLGTSRTTVIRKLKFIAEQKAEENKKLLKSKKGKIEQIVFDELLTHEHTKCKPLSVSMAVEKGTGLILGFQVAKSSATGKLAAIAKRKYSNWVNEEKKGLNTLFDDIMPLFSKKVLIESDKKLIYKPIVKQKLTAANIQFTHLRFEGAKKKERGQGEMINHAREFDPLYWINHTFAMLRYKISRLVRKTWCNTKKQLNLEAHLEIVMCFLNDKILKKNNKNNVVLQ